MSPVGISASYSQKGWQLLSKGAGMRELAKGDILVKEDFTVSDCKLSFLKKVDIYSWLFCCSETNFKVCVGWFPHQQSKLQIPACGLSVQFSSVSQSCPIFVTPMNRSTPGLPVHHQLPEFTQTRILRVSDAIQPSHPLSPLLLLRPIPPSIKVFSNESTLHMRWPKYWSFSFSIIPSKEIPGLISFRMDWLDLLAI